MELKNGQSIPTSDIEVDRYSSFYGKMIMLLANRQHHCVNYFATPNSKGYQLFAFVAKDEDGTIEALSAQIAADEVLQSMTAENYALHSFERDIHESYAIKFEGHPWLKPLRFSHDRKAGGSIYDYPFFNIESEEFHRVGVGPIHAGIIEPGHFRFICEGENIHHLEIQLGWQHRGIERLMIAKEKDLQRATIAENIAGDTVVGHAVSFATVYEALGDIEISVPLLYDRTIALEQERIAVHTGDLSAICTDIAYQLGSAVFGRLRTPMINFFQKWCGCRFAKSLIRPGRTNFPFTSALSAEWLNTIEVYQQGFEEMAHLMFDLPSVLSRIERTGFVSEETALHIGLVGLAAKASGVERDVRKTHPYALYDTIGVSPIVLQSGDVYARASIRHKEILQSIDNIKKLIAQRPPNDDKRDNNRNIKLNAGRTAISLVEGWRGMICHVAQTDIFGQLSSYKIVDPSVHNWLGLSMAVRRNGISDFPICNKSFDLSYCGHDL